MPSGSGEMVSRRGMPTLLTLRAQQMGTMRLARRTLSVAVDFLMKSTHEVDPNLPQRFEQIAHAKAEQESPVVAGKEVAEVVGEVDFRWIGVFVVLDDLVAGSRAILPS